MSLSKVLVMGDDTRGFLATIRSLGRQGIEVHAAPTDFGSPALASRYIAKVHDLPPWMGDGSAWHGAMAALLRQEGFALVIPCDERNLLPLQRYRAEFSAHTRLAIPDDAGIAALFDKHATRELARQAGVPVPRGRLAQPNDTAPGLLAELGAPVVVKPRRSFTLDALGTRGRVQVSSDPASLSRALASAMANAPADETLLEAYFEGAGVGLSILASGGRVLQSFQHNRVHERSGSSFYRISAAPDPALTQACAAIAAALAYTGVAMFEFKRNEMGWVLLEVNARPWGSLPLPVALGVDFPFRWYQLLVEGRETPQVAYRAGVYGRNVMPDLMAAVADAQDRHLPPVRFALFMARRLAELRRGLGKAEVQDVLVRDDRAPAWAEIRQMMQSAARRAERALPGAAGRARRQALAKLRHALGAAGTPRILFVCQGNICRSPFAEAALRARLPAIATASAGMIPRPGRETPALGQAEAARLGLSLESHRSAWLDRAAADSASIIVAFDHINVAAIASRYPDLRTPVIKLGDLSGSGDIADPIDGDEAVYAQAYAQIQAGVEILAGLIADAQPAPPN